MFTEPTSFSPTTFVRRAAVVAALSCVSALGAYAQQSGNTAAPSAKQLVLPALNLDLTSVDGVQYSSSVAPLDGVDVDAVASLDLKGMPDELQPPPRRRYGRRRYNDSSHNPDGSNKYAFVAGVGFTLPTGNTYHYDTSSYGFQVGGGRNFNKNFSVIAQFDYDRFGLQGRTITNQSLLYFDATGQGLDGNSHVWSFTLNPTFNFYQREGLGAYVVVGTGFYHKVTNFTLPQEVEYSNGFFVEEGVENENIDHYTSNAIGFNGGFGLTFKPSRFAGERFYAEARYVYVDNSQRQGITVANSNSSFAANYTGSNFYPANSNKTTYIPIKLGIRF